MTKQRIDRLRVVDFFAGLGGFHTGLARLGAKCVYACEANEELRALYETNYGIMPHHDIRKLDASSVPDHDVLCAGFPCQPFSKAGEQLGLHCGRDGDLFKHLLRFVEAKRPKYLMLENVANLLKHDSGKTWRMMSTKLVELGYSISTRVMSPHQFGIPQIRERLFIVGSLDGLGAFEWPEPSPGIPTIDSVLDIKPEDAQQLPEHYVDCLRVWQDFLDRFPTDQKLPSFPIWAHEFGATYPYEGKPPVKLDPRCLARYRGAFGDSLKGLSSTERLNRLPRYARGETEFPAWKQAFIRQNRMLYESNKKWINKWLPNLRKFSSSLQKLEWNCKGEARRLDKHIVQFRASGVRVKRSNWAPALIAMTTTQVPVIVKEKRYMTVKECARLQGLGELHALPAALGRAYRALGNAVNSDLVEMIGDRLLSDTLSSRLVAA